MSVSRINIDGVPTFISLGINEEEIDKNELRIEDTIELDEIIKEISEVNDRKN